MSDEGKKALRCSFCGKREQQVHRMIQGPVSAFAMSACSFA